MGKLYRIRDGERFVQPSGEVKHGGETIELDEDTAALHAARLDLLPVDATDDDRKE
jgi:hypothetical protein